MPPDLRSLPALRTLAEERARDAFDAEKIYADAFGNGDHWGYRGGFDGRTPESKRWAIGAQLALLADLTRRASRNDIADLVAEAVCARTGWPAPSSVSFQFRPGMLVNVVLTVFIEGKINPRQIEGWTKPPPNGDGVREPKPGEDDQEPRYRVTIGRHDDPAEALAAVALAVLR